MGDLAKMTIFDRSQKKGSIDVWWLYDDGGEQFSDTSLSTFVDALTKRTRVYLGLFCMPCRSDDAAALHHQHEGDVVALQAAGVRAHQQEARAGDRGEEVSCPFRQI